MTMDDIGRKARAAAAELAFASAERKATALIGAAEAVWARRRRSSTPMLKTWPMPTAKGLSAAMMDRLRLDDNRVRGIVDGLRQIAPNRRTRWAQVMAEWDMPERAAYPAGAHAAWA
jgi:glutamate-5-semialdehyde dehydrogenase